MDDDLKPDDVPAQLRGLEDGGPGGYKEGRAAYEGAAVRPLDVEERSVVAIYVIEYLWKTLGAELAELKLEPIDARVDVIGQIVDQIRLFLWPKLRESLDKMRKDPDQGRHFLAHEYLLRMAAESAVPCVDCGGEVPDVETPFKNIFRNMLDGIKVAWALIELVANKLYTDGCSADDMEREFVRVVDSKQFLRMVLSVGFSSFVLEGAFIGATFLRTVNERTVNIRNVLDPDRFEWVEVDSEKVLKMKDEARAAMAVAYAIKTVDGAHVHGALNKRGCPAGAAKGKESVVMAEFVKWLVEIAKSHYIAEYLSAMRKMKRSRVRGA